MGFCNYVIINTFHHILSSIFLRWISYLAPKASFLAYIFMKLNKCKLTLIPYNSNLYYMKKGRLLFVLSFAWLLASCIQKEELNAEADILSCEIKEKDILISDPIINDSEVGKYIITVYTYEGADLSSVTPVFTLTEGAVISPESGVSQDFSKGPIIYTVTSQDGKWNKDYTVSAIPLEFPDVFSFETLAAGDEKSKFHTFVEEKDTIIDGRMMKLELLRWASGNGGFAITGAAKKPSDYPTFQDPNGYKNNCAKLVTKKTGFFGESVGMPIAAGNLFLGQFDVKDAVATPLEATKFGVPFTKIPTRLTGFYKFTPGEKYMDGKTHIKDKVDQADIYGVFYDSEDRKLTLDGSNSLNHKNIIALARPKVIEATTEWTRFDYEFVYNEGFVVDKEKLKKGDYKLALVFSSSVDGAEFKGAPGSTLYIDEVEILTKK